MITLTLSFFLKYAYPVNYQRGCFWTAMFNKVDQILYKCQVISNHDVTISTKQPQQTLMLLRHWTTSNKKYKTALGIVAQQLGLCLEYPNSILEYQGWVLAMLLILASCTNLYPGRQNMMLKYLIPATTSMEFSAFIWSHVSCYGTWGVNQQMRWEPVSRYRWVYVCVYITA